MQTKISVFLKDYDCYVIEQPGKTKGIRYRAYGRFKGKFISAQGSTYNSALRRLKQKVEIALDD